LAKVRSGGLIIAVKDYIVNKLKIVHSESKFTYLGVVFSRSGSYLKAKKHLYEQATKAMY